MRLVLLLSLIGSTAEAAIRQVGPGQPYTTITDAVAASRNGDVIAINTGTYDEAVEVNNVDLSFTAVGLVEWTATDDNVLAIYDSTITITGILFHPDGGRGLRSSNCVVSIADSEFSGNNNGPRSSNGASIAVYDDTEMTISNTRFFDNASTTSFFGGNGGNGGAIYVVDGDLIVDGSTFSDNEADYGGAIHHAGTGTTTIRDCTFSGNAANERAGALFITDDAVVSAERVLFQDNNTQGNGGAIRWEDASNNATVTLEECSFLRNEADGYGGAIAVNVSGDLVIRDTAFLLNTALDGGGAISAASATNVEIVRAAVCGNGTDGEGGGLRLNQVDASSVTNSAFVDNDAGTSGAGIYILEGEHTLWNNNLLDSNASSSGGAVRADGGTVVARNNLIAWTSAGNGVDGSARFDIDYSGWWQNTPANTARGIQAGTHSVSGDPLLMGYVRDGVCDDDLHLTANSPLVNTGDPARNDLDGTRSDIGAFGGPDAPASTVLDGDNDGTVDAYDCAPSDPAVHPGATETCNGLDDDCDGTADSPTPAGAATWYADRDRDGFGDDTTTQVACNAPRGYVNVGGDCDDRENAVNPDAEEICDDLDNDCDGEIDADAVSPPLWFADTDADGYGDPASTTAACLPPQGYSPSGDDCDDANNAVFPNAVELCNDIDDNCDGTIDGDDAVDQLPWYADGDGDGYGVGGRGTIQACDQPASGYSRTDDDCDDANADIHPQAPESCEDPADMNCDGSTGRQDLDTDGTIACEDCDDQDATTFPGAPDVWYDGVIQDCDRLSDYDQDADGYESDAYGGDDCADQDAAVNPGVAESFSDLIDNNCDGQIASDPFIDEVLKAGCAGCSGTSAPASLPGAAFGLSLLLWRRRRV
jgi:predicted outer membrane repeat protein